MATVMQRVTTELRDTVKNLAQGGETFDATLRRLLGMVAGEDEGVTRSLSEWPFKELGIGATVVIPWPIDPATQHADPRRVNRIRRAVWREQRITTKLFHMRGTVEGLRIERLK